MPIKGIKILRLEQRAIEINDYYSLAMLSKLYNEGKIVLDREKAEQYLLNAINHGIIWASQEYKDMHKNDNGVE